jgi:ankyrin repeat protein
MSDSLPERPDLDQLRRQAKELRDGVRREEAGAVERFVRHHGTAPQGAVTLAAAQLVIARELGFASWPRLKAAVEAHATSPKRRAEAFVAASVEGRLGEAATILDAFPDVASHSVAAAAVLGAAQQLAQMLTGDPAAAVTVDEVRGWPPLLYACYSRWQIDPRRAAGLTEVVRLLLDAGASPNTNDGARYPRSALKGSVEANNSDMTRLLLRAGANPDVGQPIAEAVGHGDHRCLELLLSHGARVAGTWAVGAAVHHDDPRAVALLVEALRGAAGQVAQTATEELPDAVANASFLVVVALLEAGADPKATDSDGVSALRRAVRAGKDDTAARLRALGAAEDGTDVDRYIGACLKADRHAAEQLLEENPDLHERLTEEDRAVIVDAAASASGVDTIALMLDLGFSSHARNDFGEQPLHTAAYHGNAAVVRLLLDAGADVDARDTRFDASPLAFATVGSGEAGKPGNWIEAVRLLVGAGASRHDVWISEKPPSEEVIALLRSYGITPDVESEHGGDDADDTTLSLGTGVMADIARHLETAYRTLDLELLGSLLHPDVRWSGECSTSAEVLDWYQRLLADGTRATVESVEVDRDAVLMGIIVAGQAEGARPAPAEHVVQVFTVDNDEIVEIRGYPDRPSALART